MLYRNHIEPWPPNRGTHRTVISVYRATPSTFIVLFCYFWMAIHFCSPFSLIIWKEQREHHLLISTEWKSYGFGMVLEYIMIIEFSGESFLGILWRILDMLSKWKQSQSSPHLCSCDIDYFPLLQSVSYILWFPALLPLLNLVFLCTCPLSVSLINDFNYRHFRSSCVRLVVTFGRSWMGKKRRPKKGPCLPAGVGTGLVITSLCQSVNSIASSHLCSPAGFFQCCLDKWIFALTRMCPLKMGATRTFGLTFHQALVTSSGSHEHIA